MTGQRRGRRIAMGAGELDDFLNGEHVCRVATTSAETPHVTPLWYVWYENALWLYSLTRSQRWADIQRHPRVAVLVDAGHEYAELRGAELIGDAEPIGEAPRTGKPEPLLEIPERLFAQKYFSTDDMPHDGRHAWLRVTPVTTRSWDFRKLPAG